MPTTRTYRIAAGTAVLAGVALGITPAAHADSGWPVAPVQTHEAPAASPTTPAPTPVTPWDVPDHHATTVTAPAAGGGAIASARQAAARAVAAGEQAAARAQRAEHAAPSAHRRAAVRQRTTPPTRHLTVRRAARAATQTPAARPPKVAQRAHTGAVWHVAPGETLSLIASLNRTTVDGIVAANRHAHPSITRDYIRAGWTLKLPGGTR